MIAGSVPPPWEKMKRVSAKRVAAEGVFGAEEIRLRIARVVSVGNSRVVGVTPGSAMFWQQGASIGCV